MSEDPTTGLARRSAAAMFAADEASRLLGIEISDVAAGRATARMTVTATMLNGHGIAHGGYVFLLADTAFAFACNTYGRVTVARSAEIVFVAPVHEGEVLIAAAEERLRFGQNGVYDVTVRGKGGVVVAEFRGQSRALATALVPKEDQ